MFVLLDKLTILGLERCKDLFKIKHNGVVGITLP